MRKLYLSPCHMTSKDFYKPMHMGRPLRSLHTKTESIVQTPAIDKWKVSYPICIQAMTRSNAGNSLPCYHTTILPNKLSSGTRLCYLSFIYGIVPVSTPHHTHHTDSSQITKWTLSTFEYLSRDFTTFHRFSTAYSSCHSSSVQYSWTPPMYCLCFQAP